MPIKINDNLSAIDQLHEEGIFTMTMERAHSQRVRPLKVCVLNLMPLKKPTEIQLLRLLGNSPLQIEVDFCRTVSRETTHTDNSYLDKAYLEFDDIKDRYYDAFLMTGAPVETYDFEDVDYWQEIVKYLDWAEFHCYSTMSLCWGAQAALYHYYGVNKRILPAKMFGIFPYGLTVKNHPLLRGFDDRYFIPQSRHTAVDDDAIDACKSLQVLSRSVENGINICATKDLRRIFVLGHFEYDRYTLADEYYRDKKKNLPIAVPRHYFPENDSTQEPVFKWRSYAHLFYMNWLNIVYQETPYDLSQLAPASGNKLDKALNEYNKILYQLQQQLLVQVVEGKRKTLFAEFEL